MITARPAAGPPRREAPLDFRDRSIVRFILAYSAEMGRPPTFRDLAAALWTTSFGAVLYNRLLKLRRAGYVTWDVWAARTLAVTVAGELWALPPRDEWPSGAVVASWYRGRVLFAFAAV